MEYLWQVKPTDDPNKNKAQFNLLEECGASFLKPFPGFQIYTTPSYNKSLFTVFGDPVFRRYDIGDQFEFLDNIIVVDEYRLIQINQAFDVEYTGTTNKGVKVKILQIHIP